MNLPTRAIPFDVLADDFDGDGFHDVVIFNEASDSLTVYRQRYITPHTNLFVDTAGDLPEPIVDPRHPPRYRLELPAGAFKAPTQVCILPGSHFPLPQAEAARRGTFLTIVTDPVRLMRETVQSELPCWLTLRLRGEFAGTHPVARGDSEAFAGHYELKVFRRDPTTGSGAAIPLSREEFARVPIGGGTGVRFPITQFGDYIVALERCRTSGCVRLDEHVRAKFTAEQGVTAPVRKQVK